MSKPLTDRRPLPAFNEARNLALKYIVLRTEKGETESGIKQRLDSSSSNDAHISVMSRIQAELILDGLMTLVRWSLICGTLEAGRAKPRGAHGATAHVTEPEGGD